MSRILIAYSSKTGITAECAALLSRELKGLEITLADLDRERPEPGAFDAVVIGGSIRFGRLRPAAKRFLREYAETLEKMPHGLFLCCGFGHDFEEYAETEFSRELRESAFAVMSFGGVLKLKKASVAERLYLYHVRTAIRESEIEDGEYTPTLPGILPENIGMMATALRREIARKRSAK